MKRRTLVASRSDTELFLEITRPVCKEQEGYREDCAVCLSSLDFLDCPFCRDL